MRSRRPSITYEQLLDAVPRERFARLLKRAERRGHTVDIALWQRALADKDERMRRGLDLV